MSFSPLRCLGSKLCKRPRASLFERSLYLRKRIQLLHVSVNSRILIIRLKSLTRHRRILKPRKNSAVSDSEVAKSNETAGRRC